jgi:cytochrome P450
MRLTLRIVGKTLLGIDIAEGADQLGRLVTAMLRCTDEMLRSIVLLPDWVPTARVRRLRQTVAGMHEMVQRIIEERRRSGGDHGDLLSMLLLARDDAGAGMSDEQVRDEVLTMILAGHETTANTLAWALYLLSQNPAAGQALHAEVTTVLGDRAPTLADLPNLPLCEHVLKESLRLYPPAPVLSRQALADTEMVGGYAIDPEAMIVMSPYYMHRDPRFFIEPLRFWPERWAGGLERSLPRGCYFPFGDGPRICLGQQFAMLEARLVLATLVRRFRYTLPPGHQVEEEAAVTLRPRGGLRMRLGAETAPA